MSDTPSQPQIEEVPSTPHPWHDLPAEQFRLLRLPPLPTDRESGPRPLRFVQLGRVERHSAEQSLLRLTLSLPGQRVRPEQNHIEIWLDHRKRTVRFVDDANFSVEPDNRGLGRFLMSQGISWAQRRAPGYAVEGGSLPGKGSIAEGSRMRRDRILQALGFTLSSEGEADGKVGYGAAGLNVLKAGWNHEKVQPLELLEAAVMLQQADRNLAEQEVSLRKLEEKVAILKREDSSLRFTIGCLAIFAVFQAALLIWIATH
ncbi:hypothetical protein [Pseudomonas sp. LRF_L74]|uniref:hypothetical protein n=1 Tax=Pseudomonas sp. LRF_L74 TaxID=3369422 RepID=UPI003F5EB80E